MRRVVTVAVLLAAVATVVVAAPADAHQKGTDGCSVPYIGVGRADRGSNWDFHDECDWHDLAYVYHWYGHSETARKAADDRWRDLMVWDCYSRHRNLPWWNPWPRQDCLNVAWTYYSFVRAYGEQPYRDAWLWGWRNGMH
jgi:hypothetical protein